MDIMANYYSVKDRVKSTFVSTSSKLTEQIHYLNDRFSTVLRSNRRLKTDLDYEINRIDILLHEMSHLKQQVISMSNSAMNETGEIVLTQDVPTPTFEEKFYHSYEKIIDRLKGDIIEGIRSHSLDSFKTIEKDRVYFYIKAACDNLDAELTQILVGREEQLADEYASQFEFVEDDDPGESRDC
jgi:hypothetical protein|tara:strand:- start:276 stop:827 length:552 start_codon:yes stop_codon:yes gene_type:complete